MRNPLPDFILTLVVLTAIFIAVHSYNTSLVEINTSTPGHNTQIPE